MHFYRIPFEGHYAHSLIQRGKYQFFRLTAFENSVCQLSLHQLSVVLILRHPKILWCRYTPLLRQYDSFLGRSICSSLSISYEAVGLLLD